MDNDVLINQARRLCATLQVKEITASTENIDRLERLITCADCRYQRRLNRCVLCYQTRPYDCVRESGKKPISCARRRPINPVAA